MPYEFRLPAIDGEDVEAMVVTWFKEPGQPVQAGELLLEVQVAKAVSELTAPVDGTLAAIRVAQGEVCRTGGVLAVLALAGEDWRAVGAGAPTAAPAPAAAPPPEAAPDAGAATRTVPLTPEHRTMARRMLASLRDTAQLTLGREQDVSDLVALRERGRAGGAAWTLTDLVHRAVVLALAEHPLLQAVWTDAGLQIPSGVDLAFAVADGDRLLTPVIRAAHRLDLAALARERARLAAAVRARTISPADLRGSTFTVTNLGGYGVDFFTPVLNPPQSAVLGVGRTVRRPGLLPGGSVGPRTFLTLSLTFDHRVLAGAPAALFLDRLASLLGHPAEWA